MKRPACRAQQRNPRPDRFYFFKIYFFTKINKNRLAFLIFFRTKVLTNVKKYGIISYVVDKYADVAELADARDLKSRG